MPVTIYPTDDERLIRPHARDDDELARLRADNIAMHELIEAQREIIVGYQTSIGNMLTHTNQQRQAVREWCNLFEDYPSQTALDRLRDILGIERDE